MEETVLFHGNLGPTAEFHLMIWSALHLSKLAVNFFHGSRASKSSARYIGCKAAAEAATDDEVTAAVETDPAEVPVPSDGNGIKKQPRYNQGAARPLARPFQADDDEHLEVLCGYSRYYLLVGAKFELVAGQRYKEMVQPLLVVCRP
jgi:hypothetical protein